MRLHLSARRRLLRRRAWCARRDVGRFVGRLAAALRAAVRRVVRATVPLVILAVVGLVAGAGIAIAYGQYGFHPGRSAAAWAAQPARFVGPTSCAACHPDQAAAWAAGPHAGVTCESCHGPMAGHPGSSPAPSLLAPAAAGTGASAPPAVLSAAIDQAGGPPAVDTSTPTSLCLSCHSAVVGRPIGFPTIDPAAHYAGPACIVCHDPHAAMAPTPPTILHPLAGLPACLVCHGPSGMRPLPAGHPTWPGDCLACHRPVAS